MKKARSSKQTSELGSEAAAQGIRHVAFIMDGNGRWAKKRGLARHFGHQEGFKRVREIAQASRDLGIECMSLYAFSTENWTRPQDEIDFLFNYLDRFLVEETPRLIKEDCRLMVSGDVKRLPEHSQIALGKALKETENGKTFILNVCLNYGGKQDILKAARSLAQKAKDGALAPSAIDEATFENELDTAGLPELDLLIRTSGEQRLSNFMMYQLAYSELIFTPTYWPDFTKARLLECLAEFQTRQRRFGGL